MTQLEWTILAAGILIALGLSGVSSAINHLAKTIEMFYNHENPRDSKLSSIVEALRKRL